MLFVRVTCSTYSYYDKVKNKFLNLKSVQAIAWGEASQHHGVVQLLSWSAKILTAT